MSEVVYVNINYEICSTADNDKNEISPGTSSKEIRPGNSR
jgi:hypothetical protein